MERPEQAGHDFNGFDIGQQQRVAELVGALIMPKCKTEAELRDKLAEVLATDGRIQPRGMTPGGRIFCKTAAAKTLLWALGENDDDRWFIIAAPGPAQDVRAKDLN